MMGIYIHTRDRIQFLSQSLGAWVKVTPDDIPINLVVEPDEGKMHKDVLREWGFQDRVGIIKIKGKNKGMGNSRQVALLDATSNGMSSFITTDDDLIPLDNPWALLDDAAALDAFGVGAYFSMYGLLMKIKPNTGMHAVHNGLGKRCFAMNTDNLNAAGGFPVHFKGYDDHEVQRRGIAELGLVWLMDSDFKCTSIAKIGDPGGMVSLPGYARVEDRKHNAHLLTYEAWPQYVSNPDKCDMESGKCKYVMQWKRFHKDYGLL